MPFLNHGLSPSTCWVYQSVQHCCTDFCQLDGHLSPEGAFQPEDKPTLMHFATPLADGLNHSSIKVHLSAVQSLHIDSGLPDLLINCLQLQWLLRGTKHVQGSSTPKCLPIPIDVLQAMKRSLDLSSKDHIMLQAARCL